MSEERRGRRVSAPGEVLPPASVHDRFIEVLQDLPAVTWEMDAQTWRFTFVSPRAERVFGYPVKRWYDEPTFWQDQLLDPEDRPWCVHFCTIASAQCRNHAFLYRARTADGRSIWVKDVVRVIPDETGAPAIMRGIMLDVTDELGRDAPESGTEIDYDAPDLAAFREALVA